MRVIVRMVTNQKIIAESIGLLRESVEHVLRSGAKQVDFIVKETCSNKSPPFRATVVIEIDALREGD